MQRRHNPRRGWRWTSGFSARFNSQAATSSQPVTIVRSGSGGFDWGDAAIGAGGGVAILLIGLGSALGVVRYRHDHAPMPG